MILAQFSFTTLLILAKGRLDKPFLVSLLLLLVGQMLSRGSCLHLLVLRVRHAYSCIRGAVRGLDHLPAVLRFVINHLQIARVLVERVLLVRITVRVHQPVEVVHVLRWTPRSLRMV